MSSIYSVGSNANTNSTSSSTSTSSSSSTSSTSSSKDVLRITGMASGLDVDGIVAKLMTSYQEKIDNVKKSQQKVEWKQQMYQKLIAEVKDLQSSYFDVTDPTNNVMSASFYNTIAVDNNDTTDMAITADTDAALGAYSVNVDKIATGASISSDNLSSMVQVNNASSWANGTITFKVNNDTPITVSCGSSTGDVYSLANSINNQINQSGLNGKVSVSAVSVTDPSTSQTNTYLRFNNLDSSMSSVAVTDSTVGEMKPSGTLAINKVNSISSDTTLAQLNPGLSTTDTYNLAIKYKGGIATANINIKSSGTLGQLAAAISSATNGEVYGQIDDLTGQLVIKTKDTGSTTSLQINSATSSADLLSTLKLTSQTAAAYGTDAKLTITPPQGQTETVTEGTNNFTINGLTFNLTNKTSGNVSVNVSQDTDSVFKKFKGFMDKYNSVINDINSKLKEKVNFDYSPLTDAQKKSMNQSDIDAWNTKAQQGLLNNDDDLSNFAMDLKNSFYQVVKGVNFTLGKKMGLDLSGDFASDGNLVFSDNTGETFKNMLNNKPNDVINFFCQTQPSDNYTNNSSTINTSLISSDKGIFQDLNDVFEKYVGMTGVTQANKGVLCKMAYYQNTYSNYGIGSQGTFMDQIFQDNTQITKLQKIYDDARTSYYNKFSKLEAAISSLNSQASVLSMYTGSSS